MSFAPAARRYNLLPGVGGEVQQARIERSQWRVIIAVSVGNALEWFDFVIYGYFAVAIAQHFFPSDARGTSVLLALAGFGVGFVVRPLGALFIGAYGDRRGRKPALTLTIGLMTAATAIIAFTPGFALIGLAAPILVLCARLLQGFSAGGEFGSATALLAEQNPARRGFFTSWQFASQAMTGILATGFGALLVGWQSEDEFNAWGWRLPFIFGLLIGPAAYYIRTRIDESPEFLVAQTARAPLHEIFSSAKGPLFAATAAVVLATVATYTLVYLPTFAVHELGLPLSAGLVGGLAASGVQLVLVPLAGALSDRWGRLPLAFAATIAIFLISFPLFSWLTETPTLTRLLAFQICTGALSGLYLGVLPAMLSELLPASIRTTGLSLSYAVAVTIFGGFAPFINAGLIRLTGSKLIPCFYLMAAAAITCAALIGIRRLGIR